MEPLSLMLPGNAFQRDGATCLKREVRGVVWVWEMWERDERGNCAEKEVREVVLVREVWVRQVRHLYPVTLRNFHYSVISISQ